VTEDPAVIVVEMTVWGLLGAIADGRFENVTAHIVRADRRDGLEDPRQGPTVLVIGSCFTGGDRGNLGSSRRDPLPGYLRAEQRPQR
jgi:hypothetical protein